MNGEPLPMDHGAPVGLRVEPFLGYRMVKYLRSIKFVEDYRHIGEGGREVFATIPHTTAQRRERR